MPWWVVVLMTCGCMLVPRGSYVIRRCNSVFGQRVGLVIGFIILMSGRVADAEWEDAGQRRPHAFGAEHEEILAMAL